MAKNFLNGDKSFKLRIWMLENRDRISELTADEATGLACKELGFLVTKANVQYLKHSVGVTFVIRRITSGRRVSKRSLELHNLRTVVARQGHYLKRLYDELGLGYGRDLEMIGSVPKDELDRWSAP